MDRERLKGIHQTDLTESRVNQDFVDWLRTKGVTWLLVFMIALVAYLLMVRWNEHRSGYRTEAWRGYRAASLPSDLEDVADKYGDVGAVAELSRLRAAQQLLGAVQLGTPVGAEPESAKQITPEEREEYLRRADGLFKRVVEADDGKLGRALITSTALSGRAEVAESMGNIEAARDFYEQAAKRVDDNFPELAKAARERARTVDQHSAAATLPSIDPQQQQMQMMMQRQRRAGEPVTLEPWTRQIIIPDDKAGTSTGGK